MNGAQAAKAHRSTHSSLISRRMRREYTNILVSCLVVVWTTELRPVWFVRSQASCASMARRVFEKDSALSRAFDAMVEETRTSEVRTTQEEPVIAEVTYLYDQYHDGYDVYQQMKRACTEEKRVAADYCEVSSTTFMNTYLNIPEQVNVQLTTKEVGRPVCFPRSCGNDVVDVVYPNPARCRKEMNCRVQSQELRNCPNNANRPSRTTNLERCQQELKTFNFVFAQFRRTVRQMETNLLTFCGNSLGEGPDFCDGPNFGNYSYGSRRNFATVDSTDFAAQCTKQGGLTCRIDEANATYKVPVPGGDVFYASTLEQMPVCIPATRRCTEEERDGYAQDWIKRLLDTVTVVARCDNSVTFTADSLEESWLNVDSIVEAGLSASAVVLNLTATESALASVPTVTTLLDTPEGILALLTVAGVTEVTSTDVTEFLEVTGAADGGLTAEEIRALLDANDSAPGLTVEQIQRFMDLAELSDSTLTVDGFEESIKGTLGVTELTKEQLLDRIENGVDDDEIRSNLQDAVDLALQFVRQQIGTQAVTVDLSKATGCEGTVQIGSLDCSPW